jgi:hypothetical protein
MVLKFSFPVRYNFSRKDARLEIIQDAGFLFRFPVRKNLTVAAERSQDHPRSHTIYLLRRSCIIKNFGLTAVDVPKSAATVYEAQFTEECGEEAEEEDVYSRRLRIAASSVPNEVGASR